MLTTRIATLVLVCWGIPQLSGCVTAESHDPAEDTAAAANPVTADDLMGRWALGNGEVLDLRANGVFVHTAATVLRFPVMSGTWHITEFGGEQYLVTVIGGTSAQRIGAHTATELELTPGGIYDLTVAQEGPPVSTPACVVPDGFVLIVHLL